MAKPGSEIAHEEKLRELAGDAAEFVFSAPRKYPKLEADVLDSLTANGFVCALKESDMRLLVYRHGDQVCALVTELVHGGYRRRYRKISGATAAKVIADLQQ